jgi:SAM-dependent methyltransferase
MSREGDRIVITPKEPWPPVKNRRLWTFPRLLFRTGRRAFEWLVYERRFGLATMASRSTSALARQADHVPYHPSRWWVLKGVLDAEPVGSDDVFLDVGAGLGRVVIQAAQWPFRRVIGIEISPDLSAAARSNVERMQGRLQCRNIEMVTADATTYNIPDDVSVVYLCNPFIGSSFQAVLQNLHASLSRNPRRIRIVYTNPVEHDHLISSGAELERRVKRWRPSREWALREETRVYSLADQPHSPTVESPEFGTGASLLRSCMRPASALPMRARAAVPKDRDAIQRLAADVFGTRRSEALWRWHFDQAPTGPALIHVLVDGDRVVGHHAHSRFDAWTDGNRHRLALSHELMIDRAYRGLGGTRMLADAFLSEGRFDVRIGFPYDHSAVLLTQAGVGQVIGRLPRWVHPLGQHRSGLGKRQVARRAAQGFATLASTRPGALAQGSIRDPGSEFDELARQSADFARCVRVRDASYVRWRWLDEPDTRTDVVGVHGNRGELRGFVAWDMALENGARYARILDMLAVDFAATRALLVGVARAARLHEAERVECMLHDPRRWSRAALISAGFLPAGASVNVFCGSFGTQAPHAPLSLDSWYLTQGDVDFDATRLQAGAYVNCDPIERNAA